MIIFSTQNFVLLIAGLINLAMSLFIFSRGTKSKVNFYFGLMTLLNFLWATCLIIINLAVSYELTRFFGSFVYPVALMVVISLFYFAVYFPYESFKVKKLHKWLINFLIIFYTIYCTLFYKLFVPKVDLLPKVIVYYEPWLYTIFSIVLVSLMFVAIYVIYKKQQSAVGMFKIQLTLVLIAVIMGTVAGSYFNLISMYYNNLAYNHLGPLFTLFINFVVFGFIISPKEKISN
jgi:hypothetical protein